MVVKAPSLPELFVEAGRGLAELMLDQPERTPEEGPVTCVVRARDREALLVDWLNELIYLSETRGRVYTELEIDALSERELHARVRGVAIETLRTAPKAATLHGLSIAEEPSGFSARVVIDV